MSSMPGVGGVEVDGWVSRGVSFSRGENSSSGEKVEGVYSSDSKAVWGVTAVRSRAKRMGEASRACWAADGER